MMTIEIAEYLWNNCIRYQVLKMFTTQKIRFEWHIQCIETTHCQKVVRNVVGAPKLPTTKKMKMIFSSMIKTTPVLSNKLTLIPWSLVNICRIVFVWHGPRDVKSI